MTKAKIRDIQDILTIVAEDKVYQIVDVEPLLKRHPAEAVIGFLNQLKFEYKKELGKLIKINKADPMINEFVAKNFRLRMAINTIKNSKVTRQVA